MEFKNIKLQLKEGAPEGSVLAVFSTFNVIDKDGDVTLPGAFEDGAPVRISSWGHKWYELPVGRGAIQVDGERAVMDGRFFMDTIGGADTYRTVKGLEELQEWSYGFNVLDSEEGDFEGQHVRFLKKLEVPEVSPVMKGAGIDTGTLAIKGMETTYEQGADRADALLAEVSAFVERSRSLADLRAKDGRTFSAAKRDRLATLLKALSEVGDDLGQLLKETEPVDTALFERLELEYQRTLAALPRVG